MTTEESPLERWIRNAPELQDAGIVRYDIDILLHKYRVTTSPASELQLLMFVECKTFGAELTPAQADTLGMFRQVLYNDAPTEVFSTMRGRMVPLRMLGGHVLRMSHSDPETSVWMTWNSVPINKANLVDLLTFERDPDLPHADKEDWRNRRDGVACVA
jgi:hypothetical protein